MMSHSVNNLMSLFSITKQFVLNEHSLDEAAKEAVEKAEKRIAVAREEINYGDTLADLISGQKDDEPNQLSSLVNIALWHYGCGIELYERAIGNFKKAKEYKSAGKFQQDFDSLANECRQEVQACVEKKEFILKFQNSSI